MGGIGNRVAAELEHLTGKEARTVVLGHLLRGGTPTSLDRLLGTRFGAAAVRGLEEGHRGVMVALDPPHVNFVPLVSAINKLRTVPIDCDTIVTAQGPRDQLRRLTERLPARDGDGPVAERDRPARAVDRDRP